MTLRQSSGQAAVGSTIPQGFKQTEAGVIPEDWDVKRLGEGISLYSGRHILAEHCNTEGKGMPYITGPADFPCGIVQHTKYTERPKSICNEDDILITVKGSGSGSIVKSNGKYCISRQLMAASVETWEGLYIYNQLSKVENLFGAPVGLIPGLSRSDILDLFIPLPPTLEEQKAIATVLSDTDELIQNLEKLIAKKRNIKQGAMQELLTGKRRLPGFESKAGYKQTEVGLIPEDWEVKKLGELSLRITKGTTPTSIGRAFVDDGINFLKIEALMSNGRFETSRLAYIDAETHNILFRSQLTEHDLVISIAGALGRIGIVDKSILPANTNQALAIVRLMPEFLNCLKYLYHFLRCEIISLHIKEISVVGAQPNLSLQDVTELPIPLPPTLEEQKAIALVLSTMDAEIESLEAKLDKYKQIKRGMMQELLTGKIRLPGFPSTPLGPSGPKNKGVA